MADVARIPHSCIVSSGNRHQAESWSVPIIILGHTLLGGLPADEDDIPPEGANPHPMPAIQQLEQEPPNHVHWLAWGDLNQQPQVQEEESHDAHHVM